MRSSAFRTPGPILMKLEKVTIRFRYLFSTANFTNSLPHSSCTFPFISQAISSISHLLVRNDLLNIVVGC